MRSARNLVRERDAIQQLTALIGKIDANTDVEQFMAALTRDEWRAFGRQQAAEDQKRRRQAEAAERKRKRLLSAFVVCMALGLLLFGAVIYSGQSGLGFVAQVLGGTYTPTAPPIEASATIMPTQPATVITRPPTPVLVRTAKPTAIPTSGRLIAAGTVLVPAVDAENPGQQWLLANDAPSGGSWTAVSGASAADVPGGYSYTELGNATVTWTMDVPLNAGAYQLFVLDTLQYSTGVQEYEVLLDGAPAVAEAGSSLVIFGGSAAYPQPAADWLSLGSYRVVQGQALHAGRRRYFACTCRCDMTGTEHKEGVGAEAFRLDCLVDQQVDPTGEARETQIRTRITADDHPANFTIRKRGIDPHRLGRDRWRTMRDRHRRDRGNHAFGQGVTWRT